jgi:presenilin 1
MSDRQAVLEFISRKVFKLLVPVLVTLFFDSYAAHIVDHSTPPSRPVFEVVHVPLDDSSLEESIGVAIILIISILVCTAIIVMFYLFDCISLITLWLKIGFTTIVALNIYSLAESISRFSNIPIDHISLFFLVLNLIIVGLLAIFWRGPLIMTQSFLILTSIFTTLLFLDFADSTFWVLMILLILYDIAIVLTPHGLLRVLVERVQERGEAMPGMVYTTDPHSGENDSEEELLGDNGSDKDAEEDDDGDGLNLHEEIVLHEDHHINKERHDPGLMLGLGDFIFYGALVTRAGRSGWDAVMLCIFGIIFGLCVTLMCLLVKQKVLPALPFSLAFGGIFFLSSLFTFKEFIYVLKESLCVF